MGIFEFYGCNKKNGRQEEVAEDQTHVTKIHQVWFVIKKTEVIRHNFLHPIKWHEIINPNPINAFTNKWYFWK